MRISKKILAIALSILMAVSMMPFTVFADALPTVTVTEIEAPEGLDVAYKYVANNDGASYDSYLADFVISFDQAVDAGDVKLGGAYDAYEGGAWQIFDCPALAAGQDYRLLQEGVSALLGRDVSMTYAEIKDIVKEFRCGVAGLDAAGVTMTVKLKLYDPETGAATEIVSGTKEYTFEALPTVTVTEIEAPEGLDVAYKYVANNDGGASYDSYLADFVISFDQAVDAGDVKLGGAYDAYDNGNWQIFDCPALAANQEYRLLQEGVSAVLGRDVSMTYAEIKDIVKEFRCGVAGLDASGVKMTVKFNLYETADSQPIEIVSGTKEYTFDEDKLPTATVTSIEAPEGLDVAYKYVANDDGSTKYDSYLADFVISFDQAVDAGDVKLGGAYDAYDNGNWQIFDCPALAANQEYRLLQEGVSAVLGRDVSMTYAEIKDIVKEFRCGVKGLDASGVKMTVKFNLYETADSQPIEIVSGTKDYIFPGADWFDTVVDDNLEFSLHIAGTEDTDHVVFAFNGTPDVEENTTATATVSEMDLDNYYNFTYRLAPAQMMDEVVATVYDADGAVLRSVKTCLAEYLGILAAEDIAGYGDLAKALYDYGKAAAEYFGYNAGAFEQPYYNEVAQWQTSFWSASDSTGKVADVSYVATSEPALRFTVYGLTEEEAAALSVSSNIGTAAFKKRGNDIVLEVKDIPVSQLHSTVAVTVEGLGEIVYTPLLYANKVAEAGNSLARLGISIANVNYAAAALV